MAYLDVGVSTLLGLGSEVDASEYLYFPIPESVGHGRTLSEVKGAEHSCWRLVLGLASRGHIAALDAERAKPRILHFQGPLIKDGEQVPPDFQTEEFQVVFSVGEGQTAVVYENVWIRQHVGRSNLMLISASGGQLPT